MGISVIGAAASSGGGGGTNNFVLKTTAATTYVLDRTYTSGRYSLSFLESDTAFDIYAIAEDGTYAGYTASTSLEVSADFAEIVVLGAASGTRISFTHLGVLTESVTSGDVPTAGAFISSVVTSSLPDLDDTTVVNGGNFAANVAVSFINQSAVETSAKTVVRSSSTQLLITRPDAFSPDDSPFTIKVVNPGIPVPGGSNAHLLSNSVTAGTNPVWTTSTAVPYNVGSATNYTFLATDTEATDIDYSVVSGTLPAGLTLDGETGVLSGTASGSPSEGDVTAVTIRAIDTGGNFLDKAFNITANVAPTWTTAAGAITNSVYNLAYSLQLVASTGSAGGALTYTLQSGALLAGHSLSTAGVISGTSTGAVNDAATFTVRVTDEGGLFADRSFTMAIQSPPIVATGGSISTVNGYKYHTFTSSGTFSVTSPGTVEYLVVAGGGDGGFRNGDWPGNGGGGAGAALVGSGLVTTGTHSMVVGAGAPTRNTNNGSNYAGGSSVWGPTGVTAQGGGSGGSPQSNNNYAGYHGGSGGGGTYTAAGGSGVAGVGNDGGAGGGSGGGESAGGGGGAGAVGGSGTNGNGGAGIQWLNGNYYAGGGGGSKNNDSNPVNSPGGIGGGGNPGYQTSGSAGSSTTGGGGGAAGTPNASGGAGGSGIIIIRYLP
tara:strand:- start:828 stop:2801 length:1974 start_codon:yes stop_codon:yes gene_type:complete